MRIDGNVRKGLVCVCVCERECRKCFGLRKKEKCSQMCQRALTQKQTLWGGGTLEVGDHRLLENGGERNGALGSDAIVPETARDGWGQ